VLKIYSKIEPDLLMHIVNRLGDVGKRTDIIPENNFLQCASMTLQKNNTFPAHYHIKKERSYKEQIAQESWIVIRGKVKCILYDIDNHTILATPTLEAGDASYTLYGAHTYEILEDNTIVYEYKTGPYEGQEMDKRFIKNG
jgi:gamma-glutamylcyclotransferase (GGCT)/AIG2-like uncharacterized protein YtfP